MRHVFLAILTCLLTGCGSVTVSTGEPATSKNSYEEYYDGWWFGFVSTGRADIANACPQNRVAKFKNHFSVEDILLFGLTFGIYSPRTTTITCVLEATHASSAN